MRKTGALLMLVLLTACGRAPSPEENAQHYEVRGIVRGFSPDRQTIEVQHEKIAGYMPSMTMPFVVRDKKDIADVQIGDAISFRMSVTPNDFWIDRVRKVRRDDVHLPEPKPIASIAPDAAPRLREGDAMPFFTLTNQEGARIGLETFRGHPFLLTFIFTRCPVPNFCPRMSSNFAELQNAIKSGSGDLSKTRLLSVTLDPAFDTPAILKEYGAHLNADPTVWNFATGEEKEIDGLTRAFSVYRQTEGGTISHGLATALIDENGNIEKIWRGNAWKPEEVAGQINSRKK